MGKNHHFPILFLREFHNKKYFLPKHVAAAVDFVSPTTTLPNIRERIVHKPKQPNSLVNDPGVLRKLYMKFSSSDLHEFQEIFCGKYQTFNCQTPSGKVKQVGDQKGVGSGTESMLDIEYINGLSGNIETEFWGFSGRSPDNKNKAFFKVANAGF